MSVKIILFGDLPSINSTLSTLRCQPFQQTQQIRTESIQTGLTQYLLFIVKDISLVVSQSAGTAGLICLFSQRSVHELKQQTSHIISKSKELEGIPLVMAINATSKSVSLREIISQLEQLKTKDRLTLIKEIDVENKNSVESIFEWISSQRVQTGFDAQPRVVKAKAKYRQDPEENKTYDTLMKDKKFKAMSAINQEAKYLAVEKERIKEISMKEQLNKFTKNKQKMTPYDIKPSPNPRIQPNLNFFLKDIRDDKPNEVSIKIQTDEFKPKPPSPRYVPKKTGIDCSTQVEDNELFDFDREVEPILNVLTIRTLEEAVLDIEEEEEMFKMAKFRELYEYKKKQEKNLHREYLLAEEQIIRKKEQYIEKRKVRHQNKLNILKKVQAFKISGQLTNKMYQQTMSSLSTMGFISNQLNHQLNTDYLTHLIKQSSTKLNTIQTQTTIFDNFFDKDVINPLLKAAVPRKEERLQKIEKANKRRVNKSENLRVINLVFNNEPSFTSFALNFSQHFDGTQEEYQKNYIERLKEIEGKVTTGEAPQDSVEKFKKEELELLIKGRTGLLLDFSTRYGFVLAHNQFEPTDVKGRHLSLKIIAIDEHGEMVQNITSEDAKSVNFTYDKQIRDMKAHVSMDESFSFDLTQLKKVSAIIFAVKVNDLEILSKPENSNLIKHSAYGFESSIHAVPIRQKQLKQFNILDNYKPEQQKPQDGQQPSVKSCWIIPFVLVNNKKFKGWYLQTIDYLSKPMSQTQEITFTSDIVNYYRTCHQQEKDFDQQDEIPDPPKQKKSSREGKRDRRKSKQQEVKKVVIEDPVEVTIPLVSRMFPEHIINFKQQPLQDFRLMLQDEINGNEEILKNYPYGYHFKIKGKPLEAIGDLKRYKKVGDLVVESNPEPVVETERLVEGEQEPEGENEETV